VRKGVQASYQDPAGSGVNYRHNGASNQQLGLAREDKVAITVDHRFALSNPALVSAPLKKFSLGVCWPILAFKGLSLPARQLRHRLQKRWPCSPAAACATM